MISGATMWIIRIFGLNFDNTRESLCMTNLEAAGILLGYEIMFSFMEITERERERESGGREGEISRLCLGIKKT